MVNAKLTTQNYTDLSTVIGKKFLSFECAELDSYNKTYGNICLNFEGVSFEISNEQKPLNFYDDIEDVAFFTLVRKNMNTLFIPYITSEQSKKYLISENIKAVNIIEDCIELPNESYSITFDMAIEIVTDSASYLFYKGWFFDEHIYFAKNKRLDNLYPENKVVSDWNDDEDNPKVVNILRKYFTL